MAPSTMKAIKIVQGRKAEIQGVPVPKLREDYVLVKTKAVALKPPDCSGEQERKAVVHPYTVGKEVLVGVFN